MAVTKLTFALRFIMESMVEAVSNALRDRTEVLAALW
jgi:hypothetical protein